ncbi:MAG: DUF2141 domain-containing protein [Myxococcota bacterium]
MWWLVVGSGQAAPLVVEVAGVPSGSGQVVCGVWTGAEGFPVEGYRAEVRVDAAPDRVQCRFELEQAPDRIAVAVYHDVDGDGSLDLNLLGIPVELVGVSNAGLRRFGAPRYADCVVPLADTILVRLGT